MIWCYNQPKWFSQIVRSCTVRFPPSAKTFVLNAPLIFDTTNHTRYPIKLILDGSGNTIVQTVSGGKTQLFATNVDPTDLLKRRRLQDEEDWENEPDPDLDFRDLRDYQERNLKVARFEGSIDVPAKIGMKHSLEITNCTIMGFGDATRFGGAVVVSNLASFGLVGVKFSNNFARYGGALYVSNVGLVYIKNSVFYANRAASGGALAVQNCTSLYITGSTFESNRADYIGGGFYADTLAAVSIDKSNFKSNRAGSFGGGMSLYSIVAPNNASTTKIFDCSMSSNRAVYGSVLAMATIRAIALTNNTIFFNFASFGGGVYWLSTTMVPPIGLVDSNSFYNNFAPYGPDYSTEAVYMVPKPLTIRVVDYVNRDNLFATATLKDFYGQQVNDNSSLGTVGLTPGLPLHCGFNNYLAGLSGNVNSIMTRGVASFNFKSSCIPGGYFQLTYAVVVSRAPEMFPIYNAIVTVMAPVKKLTTDVQCSFRTCYVGEKFDFFTIAKDSCSKCVNGFSVEDNSDLHVTKCRPCPEGCESCNGAEVFLFPGTWRWNAASSTILFCPYPLGCKGGNATSQESCELGYHGPMCGICDWTFFPSPDGQSCRSCVGQSLITFPLIILCLILIFGVVLPAFFSLRKFAKKKKVSMGQALLLIVLGAPEDEDVFETAEDRRNRAARRSWISRFKIFSATYQIVVSSPSTFQVRTGPVFTEFLNSMKVVNFDFVSYIPLQCFQSFDYISSMLTSALGPFIAMGALALVAAVEFNGIYNNEPDRMRRRTRMEAARKRYISIFLMIISFVLTGITFKLFKIFDCFDVDPKREAGDGVDHRYLRVDTEVDCSTAKYRQGVQYAYIFIGIYPVAVPLLLFALIHVSKFEIIARGLRSRQMAIVDAIDDLSKEERRVMKRKARILREKFEKMEKAGGGIVDSITFLYEAYKPEFYFWEIVEIGRKLITTCVVALIAPGTPMQMTFSVIMVIIFIKFYAVCEPFRDDIDNVVAELGQYQIFFTFFCIMVMMMQSLGPPTSNELLYSLLDYFLVLVNLVVMVVLGYVMVTDSMKVHHDNDDDEEMEELNHKIKAGTEFSEKVSGRDISQILLALKRHPNILQQLGEKLKTAIPPEKRRKGVQLNLETLEKLGLVMASSAPRRNAVSFAHRDDWTELMKKKMPRRNASLLTPGALEDLYRRIAEAPSSEEGSSSVTSESDKSSDESSDAVRQGRGGAREQLEVNASSHATLKNIGISMKPIALRGRNDSDSEEDDDDGGSGGGGGKDSSSSDGSSLGSYQSESSISFDSAEFDNDGHARLRQLMLKPASDRDSGSGSTSGSGSGSGSEKSDDGGASLGLDNDKVDARSMRYNPAHGLGSGGSGDDDEDDGGDKSILRAQAAEAQLGAEVAATYKPPSALEISAQLPDHDNHAQLQELKEEQLRLGMAGDFDDEPDGEYYNASVSVPARLVIGRADDSDDGDDDDDASFLESIDRRQYVDPSSKVAAVAQAKRLLGGDVSVATGSSGDGLDSDGGSEFADDLRHFAARAEDDDAMGDVEYHQPPPPHPHGNDDDDGHSLASRRDEDLGDYQGMQEEDYPSDDSSTVGGGP